MIKKILFLFIAIHSFNTCISQNLVPNPSVAAQQLNHYCQTENFIDLKNELFVNTIHLSVICQQ